jgi:hypothetical protein
MISVILFNELLNSIIFSRFERTKTEKIRTITKTTGIRVIAEVCCKTRKIYTARKIIDLINKVVLKTAIIERECFKRLTKLIFDGPKYLDPLVDGIDFLSFAIFDNDPEKLLQVAASSTILVTADLGKQV